MAHQECLQHLLHRQIPTSFLRLRMSTLRWQARREENLAKSATDQSGLRRCHGRSRRIRSSKQARANGKNLQQKANLGRPRRKRVCSGRQMALMQEVRSGSPAPADNYMLTLAQWASQARDSQ